MALMLPKSVFFHVPKTGGMWVRRAIRNAGLPAVELTHSSIPAANLHNRFSQVDAGGKFTFAFVRNPADWYPSFWCYCMSDGWKNEDQLDPYMSEDFGEFMRRVLRHLPGQLSRRFREYVGPAPGVLDFVGRCESLTEDLVRALRLAGEEFDEEKIRSTPAENVSVRRPDYAPDLLRAVLESEAEAMIRFGYAAEWRASPCWA